MNPEEKPLTDGAWWELDPPGKYRGSAGFAFGWRRHGGPFLWIEAYCERTSPELVFEFEFSVKVGPWSYRFTWYRFRA